MFSLSPIKSSIYERNRIGRRQWNTPLPHHQGHQQATDSHLYYPVVLDNAVLERNKTYTVGLTITGPGSSDPDKPVDKGSIAVTISVSGWTAGATYDETI